MEHHRGGSFFPCVIAGCQRTQQGHWDNTRSPSAPFRPRRYPAPRFEHHPRRELHTEEDADSSAEDDAHQNYHTCHLCSLTLAAQAAGGITEGICGCLLSGSLLLTNFGQLICCTENNPHPMLHTLRKVRQLPDIVATTLATDDACPLHSLQ
jgi:hypothetical protein